MTTQWKKLRETDKYEVNPEGEVRNAKTGKLLSHRFDKCGYRRVVLWYDGKKHFRPVHRLVAEAFVPNPEGLPIVNHKDENKANPSADNLEWCTVYYNLNYGTARERQSESLKGRAPGFGGKHHSEETKQKMREAMSGENNPMFGKKATEETLEKMRAAHRGKLHTAETRAKMSRPVRCVETGVEYSGTRAAEEQTGVIHSSISRACNGVQATAGNFHWEYVC